MKLLAQDSNLNSHQLQLVLAELSNLIRTLQEASAVLLEVSSSGDSRSVMIVVIVMVDNEGVKFLRPTP